MGLGYSPIEVFTLQHKPETELHLTKEAISGRSGQGQNRESDTGRLVYF